MLSFCFRILGSCTSDSSSGSSAGSRERFYRTPFRLKKKHSGQIFILKSWTNFHPLTTYFYLIIIGNDLEFNGILKPNKVIITNFKLDLSVNFGRNGFIKSAPELEHFVRRGVRQAGRLEEPRWEPADPRQWELLIFFSRMDLFFQLLYIFTTTTLAVK
jgi:hypothetical protein